MASQSFLDCSEAHGLVSSIYAVQFVSLKLIRLCIACPAMTHIVDTKLIQGLGDLDLLLGIKESVGELLALTKGALNDLEARDIAQEVGDTSVVAVRVTGGRARVLAGPDSSVALVLGKVFRIG